VGQLTENRPDARTRNSLLAGSVIAIGADVLHVSYRYYWDDWSLESHTADLMYRHDVSDHSWIQPHLRWYAQNPASLLHDRSRRGARRFRHSPRATTGWARCAR
jgi:hypothetical protein